MLLLLFILLYALTYILDFSLMDLISFIDENKDKTLNLNISVTKEAGNAISQGIQVVGQNVGLGGTIAGVAAAVGKTLAKTSMPPVQRAATVIGSSAIMGLFHQKLVISNRRAFLQENINNVNTTVNINSNTDSVRDNLFTNGYLNSDPLIQLLDNIQLTNYIILNMLILLGIQLLFKLHLKDNLRLNLSLFLGNNLNNKLGILLNRLIFYNKKVCIFYI
jgi:hypothetical protein